MRSTAKRGNHELEFKGRRTGTEKSQPKAESIIGLCISDYENVCRAANAGSTITEMRGLANRIAQAEMERAMNKMPDLSPRERQEVAKLVHRVLHHPSQALRATYGPACLAL